MTGRDSWLDVVGVAEDWLQLCETAVSRAGIASGERVELFSTPNGWLRSLGVRVGRQDFEFTWDYRTREVFLVALPRRNLGVWVTMTRREHRRNKFASTFAVVLGSRFRTPYLVAEDFEVCFAPLGTSAIQAKIAQTGVPARVDRYGREVVVGDEGKRPVAFVWACEASQRLLVRCAVSSVSTVIHKVGGDDWWRMRTVSDGDKYMLLSRSLGHMSVSDAVVSAVASFATERNTPKR